MFQKQYNTTKQDYLSVYFLLVTASCLSFSLFFYSLSHINGIAVLCSLFIFNEMWETWTIQPATIVTAL